MSRFKTGDCVKITHIYDDEPKRDNGEMNFIGKVVEVCATDAGDAGVYLLDIETQWNFAARNPKTDRLMHFYDTEAVLVYRPGDVVIDQYAEGYDAGLNDAWEAARKITLSEDEGGLGCLDLDRIFDTFNPVSIIHDYSAEQAIQKLKEYEREQKNREIEERIREAAKDVPIDQLVRIIDDIITEKRYMAERKANGTVQEETEE